MRAFETHLKAVSWIIEIEFCMVTGLMCTVKIYMTGLSIKCYFITIPCVWALLHDKLHISRVVRFWSDMVIWFCVKVNLPNSVIYLYWTPIFEWRVVRYGSKIGIR